MINSPLALVSLPGAHLQELAGLIAARTGLPVVKVTEEAAPGMLAQTVAAGILVLPSNILETSAAPVLAQFQASGGKLVFVSMTWEDSWKAATSGMAPHESGLPWRAAYRHLARERMRRLRESANLEVSGSGTLEEVARRIWTEIGLKPD